MKLSSRTICACVLLFTIVAGSCKKQETGQSTATSGSTPAAIGGNRDLKDMPGTVFDVSYTPATVRVEQSSWRQSLKSVSSDGTVFVFDSPDSKISTLQEGSVLFLENLSVRKVAATATHEGHFAVKTTRAELPELIQKGAMKWNVPVKFTELAALNEARPAFDGNAATWRTRFSPEGLVYAAGTAIHLSGKASGWNYKIDATPAPNRLDMGFSVNKELDSLIVKVDANGFLKDFISTADMRIQDGSVDNFSYNNNGMNGEWSVNFEGGRGQGSTAGVDEPNIKLPTIAKIPFPIGGIPFVLTVNANLILKPGFGGKNETIKGSFKVSYNGDEGITVKDGASSANGSITGDSSFGQMLSVSIAPHAILVGMAAPKITLSLGTESTVDLLTSSLPSALADTISDIFSKTDPGKWAKKQLEKTFKTEASANAQIVTVMTITAAGAVSLVPCKLSRVTLTFKGGADAYLLGKKIGDKEIDIGSKTFVLREPDINACGDK